MQVSHAGREGTMYRVLVYFVDPTLTALVGIYIYRICMWSGVNGCLLLNPRTPLHPGLLIPEGLREGAREHQRVEGGTKEFISLLLRFFSNFSRNGIVQYPKF